MQDLPSGRRSIEHRAATEEDSACPPNYTPNPIRPPVEKNYYQSPKRQRTKQKTLKKRPEWQQDFPDERDRKHSVHSDVSILNLLEQNSNPPFRTINKKYSQQSPSKPARKTPEKRADPVKAPVKSRSLPSLSPAPQAAAASRTPARYLTDRERQERGRREAAPAPAPSQARAPAPPPKPAPAPVAPPARKTREASRKENKENKAGAGLVAGTPARRGGGGSGRSGRGFTDIKKLPSATPSLSSSTASNFATRTKVRTNILF